MLSLWNELLLSDVTVTKTSVIFKLELQVNLDNAMRNFDSLLLVMHIPMHPGVVQPLSHEGQENIFLMDGLAHNCPALGFLLLSLKHLMLATHCEK